MKRPRRRWSRNEIEIRALRILRPLGIAFFVLIAVFPSTTWSCCRCGTSRRSSSRRARIIPPLSDISTAAYERVLRSTDNGGEGFVRFLINSAVLATATVVVTLAVSILGAYAVARLDFFGRRKVGFLFLSVYLFPPILLAIPLFVVFSKLGCAASSRCW